MIEVIEIKRRTKVMEITFCGFKRIKYILRKNDKVTFSVVRGQNLMEVNEKDQIYVTKEQREKIENANR